MKPIKAWHFVANDYRLGYEDNRIVRAGKTYKLKSGKPDLCRNGMHGSKRILDALGFARGAIICRVEIWGDVIQDDDDDKLCGTHRKVLDVIDATNILHEFACRCAEDALALIEKPDPRSIAAIQAKRDFVAGKITAEELAAAESAAESAARSAESAAWSAARSAESAAWSAASAAWSAESAAWSAAWSARSAAWSAARSAESAAESAARSARSAASAESVRDAQNRRLTSMVVAAMKKANPCQA